MSGMIAVDKGAVRAFARAMKKYAASMADTRYQHVSRYAGSSYDNGPGSKWQGGVQVNLGVVDYQHQGSTAGSILANRIAESLNFVISAEEGARAIGQIVESALDAMGESDEISAAELNRILTDAENWTSVDPYGLQLVKHMMGLRDGHV